MVGRRRKRYAERLGGVVEALPFETQQAMLDGLRRYDRIITGAYSDRKGGVCPMLAAHRCGGRTDFKAFARTWDRFTGAKRMARPVTDRERRTLIAQLEASIFREEERRELVRVARQQATAAREQGERHRSKLQQRSRSWLGPFRRWDRYKQAVSRASRELEQAGLLDVERGGGERVEQRQRERV